MSSKALIPHFSDLPTGRFRPKEKDPAERARDFSEAELGYDHEQARAEASRCLSCRSCLGCGFCAAICPREAVNLSQREEHFEVEVDEIIVASPATSLSRWSGPAGAQPTVLE